MRSRHGNTHGYTEKTETKQTDALATRLHTGVVDLYVPHCELYLVEATLAVSRTVRCGPLLIFRASVRSIGATWYLSVSKFGGGSAAQCGGPPVAKGESQSEHGGMSTISWAPNGLLPIGAANAGWCEEARQDFEILQDTGQCVITRIPRGNEEQEVFCFLLYC